MTFFYDGVKTYSDPSYIFSGGIDPKSSRFTPLDLAIYWYWLGDLDCLQESHQDVSLCDVLVVRWSRLFSSRCIVKEVIFPLMSVCLSVCLSTELLKTIDEIFMNFYEMIVVHNPLTHLFNFR